MKQIIFIVLGVFCMRQVIAQSPCREVVGYYPGWQWYDRNKLVAPATIDYSRYTILQYAFMNMDADGHLVITDPWGDKNILLGDLDWATAPSGYDSSFDLGNPAYHLPNTSLAYYAHLHDVKLLMSIGGWTLSTHFPTIASSETKRNTFANECASICALYDLDGIDIDWEYPIDATQGSHFTLLLQDIREALDLAEIDLNRSLYLTAAVSAGNNMQFIEWSNVTPVLDMINLMSYDFYGTWDAQLNHNAPLFDPAQGIENLSCDGAVQRLLNEFAVDPEKINMGIPFYGRSQLSNVTPILFGQGNGSADNLHFGVDDGIPLYYNVMLQQNDFSTEWDNTAKVPYMISGENNSFVSYDNEESVGQKAQYIIDQNLHGAIIWEITGDYIETAAGSGIIEDTPLANKIVEVFCQNPESVEAIVPTIGIFPNPANESISIRLPMGEGHLLRVYNACGQLVFETNVMGTSMHVPLAEFHAGLYTVCVGSLQSRFIKQ